MLLEQAATAESEVTAAEILDSRGTWRSNEYQLMLLGESGVDAEARNAMVMAVQDGMRLLEAHNKILCSARYQQDEKSKGVQKQLGLSLQDVQMLQLEPLYNKRLQKIQEEDAAKRSTQVQLMAGMAGMATAEAYDKQQQHNQHQQWLSGQAGQQQQAMVIGSSAVQNARPMVVGQQTVAPQLVGTVLGSGSGVLPSRAAMAGTIQARSCRPRSC